MTSAGGVLFLAWTQTSGRGEDIAADLGGDAVLIYPRVPVLRHPFSTVVRYALSAVQTIVVLARRRPAVVVVTNPPLIPPLIVWLWALLSRRSFVLDSHPAGFGLKDKPVLARLQPLHRFLGRRAAGVLVTTPEGAQQVRDWGGNGIVVHEPPVPFPVAAPPQAPVVLFVGIFANDEPVDAVVDAAALLPEVTFRLTGDPHRAPAGLVARSTPNVEYVGFLRGPDYRTAVSSASLVLTLTTEPSSVMRSAYEAVYAKVPLVTTDTEALRATFPFARFCLNTGPSIAAVTAAALEELEILRGAADEAVKVQQERWDGQLAQLRTACGL